MASSLPLSEFPQLSLDPARLPRHVAVVMDGNGRWATRRGLNRCEGHRRGKDAARAVVEAARELGIPYLTLFVFSHENWQRPVPEVGFLMRLFHRFLLTESKRLMKRGVRLITVGETARLPAAVRRALDEMVALTAGNRKMTLALALSYGGRQDLAAAARRIAEGVAAGRITPQQVNEELLGNELMTAGIPDPDLLIRTSGEQRISNFFLYQLAYTELYFTETLWPDFRETDLLKALADYQARERRFGTVDVRTGVRTDVLKAVGGGAVDSSAAAGGAEGSPRALSTG
ncbi:MAG TPA: isoprenyl transferase [Candidatus Binataceae bacterium]|nr:isoprenyl transferase [Candidatus Binataceae bacterium]